MSRYEDITNAIWSDPDFEDLSLEAAMLYLWSWTNPRCGMAGIYKVSERGMLDSKVPVGKLGEALAELAASRFAFYEEDVLWVRSRVKRLRTKSPTVARSIARDLEEIGDGHPLKRAFVNEYANLGWISGALKGLSVPPGEPLKKSESSRNSGGVPQDPSVPHRGVPLSGSGGVKEEQHGPSRARARLPDPDALPDDFPAELAGHVDRVVAGLREVAEAKGAREVARGRVARLVAGRPRAPWLTELPRFVDYWLYGDGRARSQRDVVQAWQNWIEKRGDLAAVESVVRNGRARGEPRSSDELVAAARRREEHLERERRERERAGVRS